MRYPKALAGRHLKIPFSTKVSLLRSFYQSSSCFFYKGGAPLELGGIVIVAHFYKGVAPPELLPIVILLFSTKVSLLWSLGESSLWLISTKVTLLWS
jgi:hypothetical protein